MSEQPWIPLHLHAPAEKETVWACNPETGLVALACRVWVDDGDESGWLWAVSNGTIYQEGGRIVSECEMDDDYDFTHWLPLPNVPLSKKPPESPSNSPDPISGPSSHPSGDNAPESE